jgi:hypothetical protein
LHGITSWSSSILEAWAGHYCWEYLYILYSLPFPAWITYMYMDAFHIAIITSCGHHFEGRSQYDVLYDLDKMKNSHNFIIYMYMKTDKNLLHIGYNNIFPYMYAIKQFILISCFFFVVFFPYFVNYIEN